MVIAGGCRDQDDHKRVESLQNYARGNFKMEAGREVDWELNVSIEKLMEIMRVNPFFSNLIKFLNI